MTSLHHLLDADDTQAASPQRGRGLVPVRGTIRTLLQATTAVTPVVALLGLPAASNAQTFFTEVQTFPYSQASKGTDGATGADNTAAYTNGGNGGNADAGLDLASQIVPAATLPDSYSGAGPAISFSSTGGNGGDGGSAGCEPCGVVSPGVV